MSETARMWIEIYFDLYRAKWSFTAEIEENAENTVFAKQLGGKPL